MAKFSQEPHPAQTSPAQPLYPPCHLHKLAAQIPGELATGQGRGGAEITAEACLLNQEYSLVRSKNWILLSAFQDANYADMPSIFEMNVDLMSGPNKGHTFRERSPHPHFSLLMMIWEVGPDTISYKAQVKVVWLTTWARAKLSGGLWEFLQFDWFWCYPLAARTAWLGLRFTAS